MHYRYNIVVSGNKTFRFYNKTMTQSFFVSSTEGYKNNFRQCLQNAADSRVHHHWSGWPLDTVIWIFNAWRITNTTAGRVIMYHSLSLRSTPLATVENSLKDRSIQDVVKKRSISLTRGNSASRRLPVHSARALKTHRAIEQVSLVHTKNKNPQNVNIIFNFSSTQWVPYWKEQLSLRPPLVSQVIYYFKYNTITFRLD